MALQPEPDTSHAAWFTTSKAPWTQLCTFGPSGLEEYGRVFHPLPEGADEHDPDELVNVEGHLDESHLSRLLALLSRHTSTPDDCFYGLWDGFGDLHGSPAVGLFHTGKGQGPGGSTCLSARAPERSSCRNPQSELPAVSRATR